MVGTTEVVVIPVQVQVEVAAPYVRLQLLHQNLRTKFLITTGHLTGLAGKF
ncbi:hypothetical protein LLE49_23960 [Alicyclobacillus tolerans]|uniref:hypothetical protein n=1 Tax=Alicyclobacillus tolerans TaxID=90970 RepID=UPI001F21F049|nr:hypothetical protein [Alicyclobacillus tolerans]MCF8567781.1 hypothetical protein [Alicyclobacillus tolerans]